MPVLEMHARLIVDALVAHVENVDTLSQGVNIVVKANGGFPKDALHRHQDDWAGAPDLVAAVKDAEERGLTVEMRPTCEQQQDWELVISTAA